MSLLDFLKRKGKNQSPMFFDSIESMEACNECSLKFSYDGYPEIKRKFYNMPLSPIKTKLNGKIYACVNVVNKLPNSLDAMMGGDSIQIITDGIPVYIQITEESYCELPYDVMYGFHDGVD